MADPLFDSVEKEALFPDWEGEDTFPFTDFGIAQRTGRIKQVEHDRERLKKQKAAADAWYIDRFARLDQAQERLEQEILHALQQLDETTCPTPYGTAYLRKATETVWPSDADILAWVKTTPNPETLLKTKEQPDKTAIKEYMKASGNKLSGFQVIEKTGLSIRKAA